MPRIAHAVLDSQAGDACVIRARRHTLTADEAASHGGTDTGPAPYELLVSALAACTAITLRMVAARKGWELGTIHVDVELEKDPATGADRISRAISFSAALGGDPEYPHYTRPAEHRGWRVPDVLLSGHHERIAQWRREQSRQRARRAADASEQ